MFAVFLVFCASLRRPNIRPSTKTVPLTSANDWACDVCRTIVAAVEKAISRSTVESEIFATVEHLCELVDEPYRGLCLSLSREHMRNIVSLLERGVKPVDVCARLNICKNKVMMKVPNGPICYVCLGFVESVEQALNDTQIESEVTDMCLEACTLLPSPECTLCDALVKEYVPVVMQSLEQGIEKMEICESLGLCTDSIPDHRNRSEARSVCVSVVRTIRTAMEVKMGEDDAVALASQACTMLPGPVGGLCLNIAKGYGMEMMKWIEDGVDATGICDRLGL